MGSALIKYIKTVLDRHWRKGKERVKQWKIHHNHILIRIVKFEPFIKAIFNIVKPSK